jgi:ankyrin repeat protein
MNTNTNTNGIIETDEQILENIKKHIKNPNIKMDIALIRCIQYEHMKCIRYLIKIKNIVNCENEKGYTPLFYAIHKSKSEIIELLLNAKANINHITPIKHTPLSFAVCQNNQEIIQLLIDRKADLNNKENNQYTFYDAVRHNNLSIVNMLLNIKVDVNYNEKIQPSLITACIYSNIEITKKLLENINNPIIDIKDTKGQTPLHHAIRNNKIEHVKLLIEHKADINILRNDKISLLDYNSNLDIVKYIIKIAKSDIIYNYKYMIYYFTQNIMSEWIIQKILVMAKYKPPNIINNVGLNSNTPLMRAAYQNNMDICKELLKSCAYPLMSNIYSHNAYDISREKKHEELTKMLYRYITSSKCTSSKCTSSKCTTLYDAITNDHIKCAKIIIRSKVDVNKLICKEQNIYYHPVICAIENNKISIVKLLIEAGADVNGKHNTIYNTQQLYQYYEISPIIISILKKQIDTIELLCNKKADVNIQAHSIKNNIDYKTYPLIIASRSGNLNIIKILLEYKAEQVLTDTYKLTALDYALKNKDKNDEIIKYLCSLKHDKRKRKIKSN